MEKLKLKINQRGTMYKEEVVLTVDDVQARYVDYQKEEKVKSIVEDAKGLIKKHNIKNIDIDRPLKKYW